MDTHIALQLIPDEQLTEDLIAWHAREQTAQAAVIAHLLEVERRELHLQRGYGSLFAFCTSVLGMTEDVAGTRVGTMRVARDYPAVLEMLADGRLYLSSIRLLRPHLKPDNYDELLRAAAGLSKRELEKLLARRFPKPDVKPSIRKLPERHAAGRGPAQQAEIQATEPLVTDGAPDDKRVGGAKSPLITANHTPRDVPSMQGKKPQTPEEVFCTPIQQTDALSGQPSRRQHETAPLSARRYKITFTASEELTAKLEHAQALLSHTIGKGDLDTVIDRALTLLIETEEKRRFGAQRGSSSQRGESPSAQPAVEMSSPKDSDQDSLAAHVESTVDQSTQIPAPGQVENARSRSRYIPAVIRRAVYERDGHRCTYESEDGTRCSETRFLEFDHYKQPWSCGGQPTVENLTLRCRMHNQWSARQIWDRDYVNSKIRASLSGSKDHPRQSVD